MIYIKYLRVASLLLASANTFSLFYWLAQQVGNTGTLHSLPTNPDLSFTLAALTYTVKNCLVMLQHKCSLVAIHRIHSNFIDKRDRKVIFLLLPLFLLLIRFTNQRFFLTFSSQQKVYILILPPL